MFDRLHSQSRWVSAALAIVLLLLAGFSVWGAQRTRSTASSAAQASQLFETYAEAAWAVSALESIEREYRLDPSPAVHRRYEAAVEDLTAALTRVRDRGATVDRALVTNVTHRVFAYLEAVSRLFAAVDAGRVADAQRITTSETEPAFAAIQEIVNGAATAKQAEAFDALAQLRGTEHRVFLATMAAFATGLLILCLLLRILSSHLRRMRWDAEHDPITGLPNRVNFLAEVNRAVAAAKDGSGRVEVMLLDLDRFKEVNDTLGHRVGDDLLRLVGPRLATVLRDGDIVARLGGDEFGILITRPEPAEATTAAGAERLTSALREPFTVGEVALQVEASIGVALAPEHGGDAATLLQRADVAMYVAKHNGSDFVLYDPSIDVNTPRRLKLLAGLRRAIEEGQLVLHYQPEIRLSDGKVTSAEALVRWQHPTEGLLGPNEFIPLAESSGMIHDLTRYVIARAAAQANAWFLAGYQVPVAVNLSARCLLDASLPDAVREVLRREGVPGSLLKLEVTETTVMIDQQRAASVLRRLAALGVQLSIDDFGTGYTSMTYLSDLPVHEIKIDLSFVQRMLTEPKADAVVRASIDLAVRMGMTVVAEGIEDVATYEALVAHGCDHGQGYLIFRPQPAAQLEDFLSKHARGSVTHS